jgi:hypothetical protein
MLLPTLPVAAAGVHDNHEFKLAKLQHAPLQPDLLPLSLTPAMLLPMFLTAAAGMHPQP